MAASRKQEVALGLLRSNQLTFLARSEREREEWMAGLALVPGVFRWARAFWEGGLCVGVVSGGGDGWCWGWGWGR